MIEFTFAHPTSAINLQKIEERIGLRMKKVSTLAIASLFILAISAVIMGISIAGLFGTSTCIIGFILFVLSLIASVFLLGSLYFVAQELKYYDFKEFRFLPREAIASSLSCYKHLSSNVVEDILQNTLSFPELSALLDPEQFFLEFPYVTGLFANHSMEEKDRLSREACFILLGEISWRDYEEKIFPWLNDSGMTCEKFFALLKSHFDLENLENKIEKWIMKGYPEINLSQKISWDQHVYQGCLKFLKGDMNDCRYQRYLKMISYFSGEFPALLLALGKESNGIYGCPQVPKNLTWDKFIKNMPSLLERKRVLRGWKISLDDFKDLV
ncbi:hypothetical protein C10C_0109 [Chlamydia serpentis]|uniref:Uncharacterized protein n=1 Tax=Chlamydia serpentis TaxID=1967782 RepID=A0A2R8FA65_9CHLA|nr:hypothetical protein [Chlamydia serpentis]SPN73294.1 hypothetical protein C10C_0109 [Chlamydia serpentis]